MNLTQISGSTIPALVDELRQLIARINTVWSKEHTADGYHRMPRWVDLKAENLIGASDFPAVGAQTWTSVTVNAASFKKSGTDMGVTFELSGTVGGTPGPFVVMKIPGGFSAKRVTRNMIYFADAGTLVDGMVFVQAAGQFLIFCRRDQANLTAGTADVSGQIFFETTT